MTERRWAMSMHSRACLTDMDGTLIASQDAHEIVPDIATYLAARRHAGPARDAWVARGPPPRMSGMARVLAEPFGG